MPKPQKPRPDHLTTSSYAGARANHGENVQAVKYIARHCQDRDDFNALIDALNLNKTVDTMRKERQLV